MTRVRAGVPECGAGRKTDRHCASRGGGCKSTELLLQTPAVPLFGLALRRLFWPDWNFVQRGDPVVTDRLEEALNHHRQALSLRHERQKILAANIANADTPGFKARDIDFRTEFAAALGRRGGRLELAATAPGHLARRGQLARLELDATAQTYRLEDVTRFVTDIELVGVLEQERELEDGKIHRSISRTGSLEFTIPIFDSGQARMRKGELAYMRAANQLAEKAVNVRSEARSAYIAYRSNYDIARHYRNSVLPLRKAIEDQSLLTYNGMITSTFELISDAREKIDSTMLAVNAKRDFWIAEANLAPVIYGGSTGSAAAESEVASAEEAPAGGH